MRIRAQNIQNNIEEEEQGDKEILVLGAGAWLRGATPGQKSGAVAETSHPTSEVRSGGCPLLEQP